MFLLLLILRLCRGWDENGIYCGLSGNRTQISGVLSQCANHYTTEASLMSALYPRLSVYAAPCIRGQCSLLHSSPWNCKPFKTYYCIYTDSTWHTYIHRVGSSTAQYRIIVTATSVVGEMKMRTIVPRAEIEPTSLAPQASVLSITPCRIPWCHHYTYTYLSMQLLA